MNTYYDLSFPKMILLRFNGISNNFMGSKTYSYAIPLNATSTFGYPVL